MIGYPLVYIRKSRVGSPLSDATYPVSSVPDKTPGSERPHGLVQVLRAGAIYFLIVVGAEFVLEVVRFQVVALHVNERLAEMLEIPNVLLATIIGARWVVDRFTLPPCPAFASVSDLWPSASC